MKLNVFEMYLHAGFVVQFVMLVLMTFSLMSWFIVFQKFILIKKTRRESTDFLEQFWQCRNMAEANRTALDADLSPEAAVFRAGYGELQKLGRSRSTPDDETLGMRIAGMENLERILVKTKSIELSRISKYLPFLATTGSATPFIGLFGTVWGIMNSFHDIGLRGSASLAVVAPGISEALVATAAGLAVAIPAVMFFNHYTSQVTMIEESIQNFSSDFLNLVERDIILRTTKRDGDVMER